MATDFGKDFFQNAWGPAGYYEEFAYGVGFNRVVQECIVPFYDRSKYAIEIGSGGGAFTKRLIKGFFTTVAVDVIEKPEYFKTKEPLLLYFEQADKCYTLPYNTNSFHFAFSYNCFCHLSNDAIKQYIASVNKCLKPGGNFVFMLANYAKNTQGYTGELGELLPFGHFLQDDRTIDIVVGAGWEIVSRNMIPEHRDIIVHLKKI